MLKRRRNARCTAVANSVLMKSRTQKILCCIVTILLSTDAALRRQASALAVVFENLEPPLSNVTQIIHIPCIVQEIQTYETESIFLNYAVYYFTLEQAMKAQRGCRGITLVYILISALNEDGVANSTPWPRPWCQKRGGGHRHAPAALPPTKRPGMSCIEG